MLYLKSFNESFGSVSPVNALIDAVVYILNTKEVENALKKDLSKCDKGDLLVLKGRISNINTPKDFVKFFNKEIHEFINIHVNESKDNLKYIIKNLDNLERRTKKRRDIQRKTTEFSFQKAISDSIISFGFLNIFCIPLILTTFLSYYKIEFEEFYDIMYNIIPGNFEESAFILMLVSVFVGLIFWKIGSIIGNDFDDIEDDWT